MLAIEIAIEMPYRASFMRNKSYGRSRKSNVKRGHCVFGRLFMGISTVISTFALVKFYMDYGKLNSATQWERLRFMTHQVFEVKLGPLAPKTCVRIIVLQIFLNLSWKTPFCSRRMLYHFQALSFNSPAMLQRLGSKVMAALIFKMYVSI